MFWVEMRTLYLMTWALRLSWIHALFFAAKRACTRFRVRRNEPIQQRWVECLEAVLTVHILTR